MTTNSTMPDPTATLPLATEFPPAARDQWRRLVEAVLKGRAYEDKLVGRTHGGLRIDPLPERRPDARPVPARAAAAPWQILQRIDHPAAVETDAVHELENGATGLSLVFAGAVGAYGYGLDGSPRTVAQVLRHVHLDAGIAVEFDLSPQAKDAWRGLGPLLQERGLSPAAVDIRFGFDPLGAIAQAGGSLTAWDALAAGFAGLIGELAAQGYRGPFAAADGRVVHAAGGSEAQELAFVLATAVAYWRALEASGIAPEAGRRMIFFRLAADTDQFLTLAKFRALRKLWARIETASGLVPERAFVSAETAWRMMTRRDPHVNLLRGTIAAFAAGLGGADAITVLPFTAALGLPDRHARRLARNTQLILLEEANLAKVGDPGAGSGTVEDLTDQLCRAAWMLFQQIEAAGGAFAALQQGVVQQRVAAVRSERATAVAHRADPITGTSEFPNIGETPAAVVDIAPRPVPAFGPLTATFPPLSPYRLAEPFEQLRDLSDRLLAETGARPKIFLATLGRPSDFTARATFAKNFFEAGGIEALAPDGSASDDDLGRAYRASGARIACLCSSDEVYAGEAIAAAQTLSAAGALHIYLAGRPGDQELDLRQAGVQDFVYAGCDALQALRSALGRLGLPGRPDA